MTHALPIAPALQYFRSYAFDDIPTRIGRLSRLARLREPVTNRYFERELSRRFGEEVCHEAIQLFHLNEFTEWLAVPLLQRFDDLRRHLSNSGDSRSGLHLVPDPAEFSGNLIPSGRSAAEIDLFLLDIGILLVGLRRSQQPTP